MSYTKLQARKVDVVTPSDSDVIGTTDGFERGCSLFVGVGGNVAVLPIGADDNSDTVIFLNVPTGSFLPVIVKKVLSTGTTATNILALW